MKRLALAIGLAAVTAGAQAAKPQPEQEPSGPITLYCDGLHRDGSAGMLGFTLQFESMDLHSPVLYGGEPYFELGYISGNVIRLDGEIAEIMIARQSLNFTRHTWTVGSVSTVSRYLDGKCSLEGPQI